MHKTRLSLFITAFFLPATLHGAEVQGAEVLLKRLAKGGEEVVTDTPATILKQRIEDYRTAVPTMSPEKAASEWLAILDTWLSLPQSEQPRSYGDPTALSTNLILQSLPPSSAWDELISMIRKRSEGKETYRHATQLFLAAMLEGDPKRRQDAFLHLKDRAQNAPDTNSSVSGSISFRLEQLQQQLNSELDQKGDEIARFRVLVGKAEKQRQFPHYEKVPSLADQPDAADLLLRVLRLNPMIVFADDATKEMAIKVAMENLDSFTIPPWLFAYETKDLRLIDAILEKFPERDDYFQQISQRLPALRFAALIKSGREADALALLHNPGNAAAVGEWFRVEDDFTPAERITLYSIFTKALGTAPNLPIWQQASYLADVTGNQDDFATLLGGILAADKITSQEVLRSAVDIQLSALLRIGKTDDALAFLDKQITGLEGTLQHTDSAPASADPFTGNPGNSGSQLVELLKKSIAIHSLLGRTQTVERDLDRLIRAFPKQSGMPLDDSTMEIFLSHNRGADLEKLLSDNLVRILKTQDSYRNSYESASAIQGLVWLYGRLERHQDVILLLDRYEGWSAPDLARLSHIPITAAKALLATGRKSDAERIARWSVLSDPNNDAGYALLAEINPPDLLPFLESLAAGNRFQERPLIWQADVLGKSGDLAKAETLVRKAIAIDPSDGEQRTGDRMRAYQVLADILSKKGDTAQAEFFGKVVSAIRQSEEADKWWSADLIPQAIQRYEKSLESFADAYCIQSRLALRYAASGNEEKAAVHYQRAFELMPDSFGRIESHCFGCEGAFKGGTAQTIAEKIFTAMAEKPDAKPQVHYLLGYLRETQQRYEEAKTHFRKAVELDPEYVNAWSKLSEVMTKTNASRDENDQVAFAIFRLSGNTGSLSEVSDLRRMWDTILEFEKHAPPRPPSSIYPLRASAAAIKSKAPDPFTDSDGQSSPREALTRNSTVQSASLLLDTIRSY